MPFNLYVPFCNLFLFFIMGLSPCQELVFNGCTGIRCVNLCASTRGRQCPCWKAFRLFLSLSSGNKVTLNILEQTFLFVKVVSINPCPGIAGSKNVNFVSLTTIFQMVVIDFTRFQSPVEECTCPPCTCPLPTLLRNMKIVHYQFSLDSFDSFEHFYAI